MSIAHDLSAVQACHIFVCGDIMLDVYIEGKVSRISPEAPVPVVLENDRRMVMGGAANVAANIASLGARATLCGRIGNDTDGSSLIELCESKNIQVKFLTSPHLPTIRKTRVMAGNQQIVRIDSERWEPILRSDEQIIEKTFKEFCERTKNAALVISDYGKGLITDHLLKTLIAIANQFNVPIIADPKSNDLSRYDGCSFLKPNRKEGREIALRSGAKIDGLSIRDEAKAIIQTILVQANIDTVILSLSEHGVAFQSRNQTEPTYFPSQILEVADVSGAGDTMVACLALGTAANLSTARTVQIANVASGVVCGKTGTAVLNFHELLQAFQKQALASKLEKTFSFVEIEKICEQAHIQKRKVVFTNGCFDILHAGHLLSLQTARGMGDFLVVGLNSDKWIRENKGPTRPIINEHDRAALLAGLSCVDAVVVFDTEDTLRDLIRKVKPEILAKGGDYKPEQITGFKELSSWGGKVEIIPLLAGHSTTDIENKLKQL